MVENSGCAEAGDAAQPGTDPAGNPGSYWLWTSRADSQPKVRTGLMVSPERESAMALLISMNG
jgi:hypothetical protein